MVLTFLHRCVQLDSAPQPETEGDAEYLILQILAIKAARQESVYQPPGLFMKDAMRRYLISEECLQQPLLTIENV